MARNSAPEMFMKPRMLMNTRGLFITGMGDNGVTVGANADVQPHSYAYVRVQAIPGWLGGSFVQPCPPFEKRRAVAMQHSDSFGGAINGIKAQP